ncbi:MAG: hypothetical protein N0C81_00825 [Candidatus Thiodiazotropha lotti]|uniref:Uncharacterized protein n=1 Tax=Candidatus Thiodiazotropha lotti TaxID=2792787 RepID=A0A9E4K6W0_9GAMM|nr:hypothetical protein [Candidatus Thiodiazotropha lotti]ODC01622.1 hypothetical protein A3197_03895 [Candidatus Thiodiazotropha endoloripes]MCG7923858.1 hypothetical protein [Candidatus Thiodiazotropha lotti]MCG7931627.1 hypothetical protein [Candidatus Thiodiazotropha lotti]MCG7939915.1 hypothetical protein [Candidatus Thiodiazotropha lotti]
MTKQNSKTSYLISAITLAVILSGCFATYQNSGFKSVFTSLSNCQAFTDRTDPNSTPYKVCPGVAGYQLIVRKVGAGRKSIEIRPDSQQPFPLSYQAVVTKEMFHLGEQAEWRVAELSSGIKPVALIAEVHAHENLDEPDQVTTTFFAVAKISATEICVTDVIEQQKLSRVQLQQLADKAQQRVCIRTPPD